MTAFTARVLEPGECYPDRRGDHPQIRRVPTSHYGVVCQACPYAVHIPCRLGRDVAEQRRRDHLTTVHLSKLCTGAVVLTEVPHVFSTSASREPDPCLSLRGADGPAGSLDGTVEQDEPSVAEPLDSAIGAGLDGPHHAPAGRHFARTG